MQDEEKSGGWPTNFHKACDRIQVYYTQCHKYMVKSVFVHNSSSKYIIVKCHYQNK